jgi:hypothetical protein
MVNISFLEIDNYKLQIYNISGQLVVNKSFSGTSIDVELPTSGIYIVNIIGKRTNYTKKIVCN